MPVPDFARESKTPLAVPIGSFEDALVTCDSQGNWFILNSNTTIYKLDKNFNVVTVIDLSTANLDMWGSHDIKCYNDDVYISCRLIISSNTYPAIYKINKTTYALTQVYRSTNNLENMRRFAINTANGDIFFSLGDRNIYRVTGSTSRVIHASLVAGTGNLVDALAYDATTNTLVASTTEPNIYKIDLSTGAKTSIRNGVPQSGSSNTLHAIKGNLYACYSADFIYKLTLPSPTSYTVLTIDKVSLDVTSTTKNVITSMPDDRLAFLAKGGSDWYIISQLLVTQVLVKFKIIWHIHKGITKFFKLKWNVSLYDELMKKFKMKWHVQKGITKKFKMRWRVGVPPKPQWQEPTKPGTEWEEF